MTIKPNHAEPFDDKDMTELQERRSHLVRRIGQVDSQLFPGWGPKI